MTYRKKLNNLQGLEVALAKDIAKPIVSVAASELAQKKPRQEGSKERFLASIDPYFLTLADPFQPTTAHIPDLEHYPSCTVQCTQRYELTVNAAGVVGAAFGVTVLASTPSYGSLVPIQSSNGGSLIPVVTINGGPIGCSTSTTATTANLFLGQTTSQLLYLENFLWTGGASSRSAKGIPTDFRRARLVSAGATFAYAGTNFDNKGSVTAAFAPPGTFGKVSGSATLGLKDVQLLPGSKVTTLLENPDMSVTYRPMDSSSLFYTDLDEYMLVAGPTVNCTTGGEMYIFGSGMTPATTVVITFVGNYECIPRFNSYTPISPSVSRSDPIALSNTLNMIQDVPPVNIGNLAITSPTSTLISPGPNPTEFAALSSRVSRLSGGQFNLSDLNSRRSKPLMESLSMTMQEAQSTFKKVSEVASPLVQMALKLLK